MDRSFVAAPSMALPVCIGRIMVRGCVIFVVVDGHLFPSLESTWSDRGVKTISIDKSKGLVHCETNHLTGFSILLVSPTPKEFGTLDGFGVILGFRTRRQSGPAPSQDPKSPFMDRMCMFHSYSVLYYRHLFPVSVCQLDAPRKVWVP